MRISTNTLLTEGDSAPRRGVPPPARFQPTPSSRRVTLGDCFWYLAVGAISTNTLLTEGDLANGFEAYTFHVFQPTPSSRRVTVNFSAGRGKLVQFQPTPSSRRVTTDHFRAAFAGNISTNTLLTEGDVQVPGASLTTDGISTNTLLTEGDGAKTLVWRLPPRFQPTPSSRRVTGCLPFPYRWPAYFNQHPPHGG